MALIEGSGILKAITMLPEWVINIYYSVTSLHHSTAFHLACLSELSRIKQQLKRHPKQRQYGFGGRWKKLQERLRIY